ncbi:hypothetical protein LZC95_40530 [Pendulispora brunnea]|uniref:Uncharacterized protein n=1 Tax=Pendulispora brunnea TaxID=2905690 RepID=A0ABZ2K5T7_9BACT
MSSRTTVVLERPLSVDGDLRNRLHVPDWPPPPHDPRERDLAMVLEGWEVRLFGGRKFQYFVTRGFWHLQLWHPEARISVLTPSRLTQGFYETFPVANWKAQAPDYKSLVQLVTGMHEIRLPNYGEVARLEKALVDDVVRAKSALLS